jgi:hypothetical protein
MANGDRFKKEKRIKNAQKIKFTNSWREETGGRCKNLM